MTLPPEVLDILACPHCRSALRMGAAGNDVAELACTGKSCGRIYPVRDGIPVLLVDSARRPPTGGDQP